MQFAKSPFRAEPMRGDVGFRLITRVDSGNPLANAAPVPTSSARLDFAHRSHRAPEGHRDFGVVVQTSAFQPSMPDQTE